LSRPSPRRYGASSAFPTLTGLVALAAGLAAVYGPANAPETPSKPCARHRGRRRCGYHAENLALTDRWGADVDTWGADSPGAALTDEGQARFRPATWSWPASQIGENAWFYASFPQMMWTSLGISALRYWHLRGATT